MGLIDIRLEVSEEEYAYLRLEAIKHNTSITGYLKRLIMEDRKHKSDSAVSLKPRQKND